MDPGRQAMIEGRGHPRKRDITSPRCDAGSRITKPSRPSEHKDSSRKAKYLTQDEQSAQYVADEDNFVLKQSKKKADIRVREMRAKPIDILAFNLKYIDQDRDLFDEEDGDDMIDAPTPLQVIKSASVADLKELFSDISSYLALEKSRRNRDYWRAVEKVAEDHEAQINPKGHDGRVVGSVSDDIDRILAPKTHDQLEALEKQIKTKLRSDDDIDTDYWEQLLRSLKVYKAKATLALIQEDIKASREARLAKRGVAETDRPRGGQGEGSSTRASASNTPAAVGYDDSSQVTNAMYDREAARGVTENEEIFNTEETVPGASANKPEWTQKHQARKPRYFNRVQMGYEWNKYNQTHYDHDNPPPKVVNGYKFNIFYPELIDKTKAPTFKIIRENGRRRGESFAAAGEEDTCLIRFVAGPPYEDIAFRIVDREWDYSAKRDRGYRSSFDKVS